MNESNIDDGSLVYKEAQPRQQNKENIDTKNPLKDSEWRDVR